MFCVIRAMSWNPTCPLKPVTAWPDLNCGPPRKLAPVPRGKTRNTTTALATAARLTTPVSRRIELASRRWSCLQPPHVAGPVVAQAHRALGRVGLDLEVEQQAAVERQEQVAHQQQAEPQLGRADGGGDHEQQRQDDELAGIAVGALLVELDELQDDQELADDQDRRRAVAGEVHDGVGAGQEGGEVGEDARDRAHPPADAEDDVQAVEGGGDEPKPRRPGGGGEAADAQVDQDVQRGPELADVVHAARALPAVIIRRRRATCCACERFGN